MSDVVQHLEFDGLNAAIELRVDEKFLQALPIVFPNWRHKILRKQPTEIFVGITLKDNKYTIDSPFMDEAKTYRDPANTLCALIVELAWARLREDDRLLCLHGAAIEFSCRTNQ